MPSASDSSALACFTSHCRSCMKPLLKPSLYLLWVFFATSIVLLSFIFLLYLCCIYYGIANLRNISCITNKYTQYFVLIIVNAVKLLVMCEVDVKGVREKLGYTQKEFAKLVFSSERTVQNWEAGKTIPPSKYEILRVLESKANGVESVGADEISSPLSSGSVSVSAEAWEIIRMQAASLERKDAQVDRVIDLLERQMSTSKKSTAKGDAGARAEVG